MTDVMILLKAARWATATTLAAATTVLVVLLTRWFLFISAAASDDGFFHQPFIWLGLVTAALGPWWALAAVVVQYQSSPRAPGSTSGSKASANLFCRGSSVWDPYWNLRTPRTPPESKNPRTESHDLVQSEGQTLATHLEPLAAQHGSEG